MVKVVVPIKQVSDLDDEFELEAGSSEIDPDFIERELNDWDTYAIEAAVALVEDRGEGEVVVVTVGDDESEDALVDCLARGASRAIRVPSDDVPDDPLAVAGVLAEVARAESPDLVLCGVQSSDSASGATGIALAGFLDLAHVAVVRRIDLEEDGQTVQVERELEGGLLEDLSVGLPCLLTVQTGANEPRYATLRAIKQAADKPRAVLSAADLGVESGALQECSGAAVASLSNRPKGEGARMLEGDPESIADQLLKILADEAGVLKDGKA